VALRWLVTGAAGMVGRDLVDALATAGEPTVALSRAELDICDAAAVNRAVRGAAPDVIVNCAAYTKVDAAESDGARAVAVNGAGVGFLADAANEAGALLVQISTDFVFDGARRTPYDVSDVTAPLSAYGRSKLAGEQAAARARKHVIVRTAWLFGVHGPNFVEAIRNQIAKGTTPLRVVEDQRGRPTYTPHLATAIVNIARRAHADETARGIVHYADTPECTWFDFARAIVAASSADIDVRPVTTAEFPRPAARPAYSVLSTTRYEQITGAIPQSWEEGLRKYLELRA
jgi:dTDP-4-dehydrorhamnose reductase